MVKNNEEMQFLGAYIPKSLAEWAKKQAHAENRNVTGFLINLLKERKNSK